MQHIINIKELRASMPEIIKRVRKGDKYIVLYRSNPAFCIIPVDAEEQTTIPLSNDPLYGASAVGSSSDGLAAEDHDTILYGKKVH
jgi:antitoxin (DNA-binding transcriptional repressor) of toxin-antitoxin stability system